MHPSLVYLVFGPCICFLPTNRKREINQSIRMRVAVLHNRHLAICLIGIIWVTHSQPVPYNCTFFHDVMQSIYASSTLAAATLVTNYEQCITPKFRINLKVSYSFHPLYVISCLGLLVGLRIALTQPCYQKRVNIVPLPTQCNELAYQV